MNQLIRCITCDELFMRTPYDQTPEYESGRGTRAIQATVRDDFQDFLTHHHGHRLEDLNILEDTMVSEKEYIDPVKTSYFKATNGKEKFVVKKFRDNINEPLQYQLIDGDYAVTCTRIEVQSEEISKQMQREFKSPFPPSKKIEAFIQLYQKIAASMDLHQLERVAEESPHPLGAYYKPDDVSLAYLLRNCHHLFEGKDYLDIEAFIHRHKEDGVLLLKATFQLQVSEKARSKKTPVPTPAAQEEKKVLKKE